MGNWLFGSTVTENAATLTASAIVQFMNQTNQNCYYNFNQNVVIDIETRGREKVNVTLGSIEQKLVLDQTCQQTNTIDSTVTQALSQQVEQLAQSIVQQFQITGKTEANNIVNAVANVATSVSNSFVQTCSVQGSQNQYILIRGRNDAGEPVLESEVNVYGNISQYIMSVTDCALQDTVVNQAIQELAQQIDQSSKSVVENFIAGIFGPVLGIIALVGIIVLAFLLLRGGRGSGSPSTVVVSAPKPQQKSIAQLQAELAAVNNSV
jgi:type IV secretory pathway VirB2 component (pilin)